ncbi:MAG: hypothetical protein KatS3mg018_2520 [Fimbriimonadales bacterium]|nr:MAG: hypothetical protein KatS3mg018_2520 [Fimbriimonadales bacterium]
MPRRRPREIHRQQGTLTPSWLGYAPWAVLAAHSLLALAYNLATPFGNNGYPNTPDEGAHFQYVAYVAQEWRLPKFEGYAGVGYEAHQPPLYYFLAAIIYALSGGEGKAVRLLSTLCSAGVVWLVWRTLQRLAPERPLVALAGMGFAAFVPMHLAVGSAVGNDALTNLLFAATLYALLVYLRDGRHWLVPSVLAGLAILTKATGVLLAPLVLMGVLWGVRLQGGAWAVGLKTAGLALTIIATLSGWWLARNALLYGDPLLQRTFLEVFAGTAKAQDFLERGMSWAQYAQLVVDWTFRSFWFAYGVPETARTGLPNFLPDSVYYGLGALTLGAGAGFVVRLREASPVWARVWLLLAGACLLLTLISFVLFVRVFFQTQGRYFYPALLPISVFWALGWERLLPERSRAAGLIGMTALMFALALGCLRYLG